LETIVSTSFEGDYLLDCGRIFLILKSERKEIWKGAIDFKTNRVILVKKIGTNQMVYVGKMEMVKWTAGDNGLGFDIDFLNEESVDKVQLYANEFE